MCNLLALTPLVLLTACSQIQTVAHKTERLPPGSVITLHMVGIEGAGLEHAVTKVLTESGFDVRSQATTFMVVTKADGSPVGKTGEGTERVSRYETPYVCRIKATGFGHTINSFTLQILHVSTGRILLSVSGQEGSWRGEEVAKALRDRLN